MQLTVAKENMVLAGRGHVENCLISPSVPLILTLSKKTQCVISFNRYQKK